MDKPLSHKQKQFCFHYVSNGCNATQAAKDAGYTAKWADKNARRLTGNNGIQAEIDRLQAEVRERFDGQRLYVLTEMLALAQSEDTPKSIRLRAMESFLQFTGGPEESSKPTQRNNAALAPPAGTPVANPEEVLDGTESRDQ